MRWEFIHLIRVTSLSALLFACAGTQMEFNTVEKTAQLRPGMKHEEVIKVLGKPKSVQFVGDKAVLKYSLHEYWKGWVPYYVVFEKRNGQLQEWYADETEYQQNQAMWQAALQTFQQQQQAGGRGSAQGGTGGTGTYMEGYDPNANYYTNDYYWEGSGYHYND